MCFVVEQRLETQIHQLFLQALEYSLVDAEPQALLFMFCLKRISPDRDEL